MDTPPGAQVSGKLTNSILSDIDRINKINNVVWMVLGGWQLQGWYLL